MDLKYLTWDEYFMGIAIFTSFRSKDPNSKVGAVIVNDENRIVGTGYNGFPAGADESLMPWDRDGEWLKTKYPFVVHAEANAILSATTHDLRNARIYTTLFPCNECAKFIAQKNISEVIYLSDKYRGQDFHMAAEIIFKAKGIRTRKMQMRPLPELIQQFSEFFKDYGIF